MSLLSKFIAHYLLIKFCSNKWTEHANLEGIVYEFSTAGYDPTDVEVKIDNGNLVVKNSYLFSTIVCLKC